MSIRIQGLAPLWASYQSHSRKTNHLLERLNAGLTVRPKDAPSQFSTLDVSRSEQTRMQSVVANGQRAVAFAGAAEDALAVASGLLDELHSLFSTDGGGAATQQRIDAILKTLDETHYDASFNQDKLFEEVGAPTNAPRANAVEAEQTVQGEVLRFDHTQSARGVMSRYSFSQPLEDAVVIATMQTMNGAQPATYRIDQVEEQGFDFALDEFAYLDGAHTEETFSVLALQAGEHQLEDGKRLVVGRATVSGEAQAVRFEQAFDAAPIVLASVQTRNDDTPVLVRLDGVTREGFNLRLQQEQGLGRDGHGAEVVGFVAFEAGTTALGDLQILAGRTGDVVTDQEHELTTGQTGVDASLFASIETYDGADPAQVSVRSVGEGSARVAVLEEQSGDVEMIHTTESVSYVAVNGVGAFGEAPEVLPDEGVDFAPASRETTHRFAVSTQGLTLRGFHSRALGDADDSLRSLSSRGGLSYETGDRSRALSVIEAAQQQVRHQRVEVDAFARYEVRSVQRVAESNLRGQQQLTEAVTSRQAADTLVAAARQAILSTVVPGVLEAMDAQVEQLMDLLAPIGGVEGHRNSLQDSALAELEAERGGRLLEAIQGFGQRYGVPSNPTAPGMGSAVDLVA